MPTEDEIFFDQATRSRGQAAHKFTRQKWLEMDGYSTFQMQIIAGMLTTAKPRQQECMALICTREDVLIKERSLSREEVILHRPAGLSRVLLTEFPILSGDQKINIAVDGFKKVGEMLDLALSRAGLSLDTNYTEYESIFGVKKSGSELRFAERDTIVKENIQKMKDKWFEEWVLVDKSESAEGSIAYVEAGRPNNIFLGKLFFTRTTLEVAGFLIHEIGHMVGLHDICALCHEIDIKRHPTTNPDGCKQNTAHGKLTKANEPWGGHVITYSRVLTLAEKNPDLAIWNADAYRRYCTALYSAEMDVPDGGWKHHKQKPKVSRFW